MLPACGAGEAKFVVNIAKRLHLLSKVDILLALGANTRHGNPADLKLENCKQQTIAIISTVNNYVTDTEY